MEILKKISKSKIVIAFILFYACIVAIIYLQAIHSDAYMFAKNHLTHDNGIVNKYGIVRNIKLYPFGLSLKNREDSGSAKFIIKIDTDLGNYVLKVNLLKKNNVWQVLSVEEK